MKSNLKLVYILLFMPLVGFSQQQLTGEHVLEDFHILKNVLEQGHPALYDYTSQLEWDSICMSFEEDQLPRIQNSNDLYSSLSKLTNHVRDGHLMVMRPQLDSIPSLFPLWLTLIDGEWYTDTDDFGIPLGSQIISIDQISGAELRNRLMAYIPSDGFNTTKKDRQLEQEFGILHFYEFGSQPSYQVEYQTPTNTVMTKQITSQSFESIGQRFASRSTFRANNTLNKKGPYLQIIDSLETAVLTINTFNQEVAAFQSTVDLIFKEIKRSKCKNLIIDIRQNEGGYPANAIHTFSFITDEPFKQRSTSEVTTSSLPEKQYSQNLVNGFTYESFFNTYYAKAEQKNGKWITAIDENEVLMTPRKKGFKGQVFVLIGGKTFSAGSSFALFCKNAGIPLIGEETGGGYYSQTGGYPMLYTLPNSGIKVLVPFVKIDRYVKDRTVIKGSGIEPDIPTRRTVQDILDARDRTLENLLNELASK